MRRVIVVGGTGAFGQRLTRGLLDTTDLSVTIVARDAARLEAVARDLAGHAPGRVEAVALDARGVTPERLHALGGFALVDAAGPFQGADYRLARAAIAVGLHYLDLADARDFVAGFGRLDQAAREAGVLALTGVSSTPALSHAALDCLTAGWRRVDHVEVAIGPGNRAPRGLSVVRAILSYAGRPVRVFLDGAWTVRPGWGLTVRRELPGLGRRWLALCETPDLDLLPARFAVRQSAVFRAGLELSVLHLGLLAASLLVRAGWLRSLAPLARIVRALADSLRPLGTDRGGMEVAARGLDAEGRPVAARWMLVAGAGDGPVVPTLPALAALRALSAGRLEARGAGPCVGVHGLEDIAAEFRPWRIATRIEIRPDPPLFAAALGAAFDALPGPVRELHQPPGRVEMVGEAEVADAEGILARFAARLFGFPRAAARAPVRVTVERLPKGERWTRRIGGSRFRSMLVLGRRGGEVEERFGPFRFNLVLQADGSGLRMEAVRWRFGPVPLPRSLAPRGVGEECVDAAGRFRFAVEIGFGRLGRLVHYAGWLIPVETGATEGQMGTGPSSWQASP